MKTFLSTFPLLLHTPILGLKKFNKQNKANPAPLETKLSSSFQTPLRRVRDVAGRKWRSHQGTGHPYVCLIIDASSLGFQGVQHVKDSGCPVKQSQSPPGPPRLTKCSESLKCCKSIWRGNQNGKHDSRALTFGEVERLPPLRELQRLPPLVLEALAQPLSPESGLQIQHPTDDFLQKQEKGTALAWQVLKIRVPLGPLLLDSIMWHDHQGFWQD